MPALTGRLARGLAGLAALAAAACAVPAEPRFDAAVTAAVQDLAAGTSLLFEDLAAPDAGAYDTRAARYRALAAGAETVRLMAEARGSGGEPPGPAGALAARLAAGLPGTGDLAAEAGALAAEYRDATPAYMADYLRNLRALEAEDRAATGGLAEQAARFAEAAAAHRAEVEAYLVAWRLWEAGAGLRPAEPGAAPEPPAAALSAHAVALRRAALADILRDALIYERDILNRSR